MKRSIRTPAMSQLVASFMAAIGTAAWALAGSADTPKEPGTRPHAASGPHSDGADAVMQSRQRAGSGSKASRSDQQFLTKAAASCRAEVEMGRLGQMRAQNREVKGYAERMVQDHARVNGELQALGSARGLSWPDDNSQTRASAPASGTRTDTRSGSKGTAAGPSTGTGTGSGSGTNAGTGMGMGMGTGMDMGTAGGMDSSHMKLSASARRTMERLQGLGGAEFDREFMKQMVTDHKAAVSEFQRAASAASDPEVRSFAQKTLPGLQEHLQMARSLNERLAGASRP